MARIIYFNGSLAITSFNVQEKSQTGNWVSAAALAPGKQFRFAVRVLNNSGDPANFDITFLKVADLFNPLLMGATLLGAHGQAIAYSKIKVAISPNVGGLGKYQFYSSSSYPEPWSPAGACEFDRILHRGDTETLYAHFKWASGPVMISPSLPGTYVPQVTMKAKELRIRGLPDGPRANLQPNT